MTEVIRVAREAGYDLIGHPELVRLNPNIPYKTRGNAALAARFGHGVGRPFPVGWLAGESVNAYVTGRNLSRSEATDLTERAWRSTLAQARSEDPGTDPALVSAPRRLPAGLYWEAVRRVVPVERVERLLSAHGAELRTSGSRQGLVGAAAATAWSGAHPTWELLSYRHAGRIGAPRLVEPASVRRAEREYPELFLCTDRATRRVLIAPHTDCPILFGLRATSPARLPFAARQVRGEMPERWVIYRTNQGSGDHLRRISPDRLGPYESAVFVGRVLEPARVGRGGHAHVALRTDTGSTVQCVAFEPTKTLPKLLARLVPGDRLRVWGGRGADPTFRLEGVEVLSTVPRTALGRTPRCPRCGGRTSSLGSARGYRCPRGHARLPPESRRVVPLTTPPPRRGRYHPTPSARRHLHPRGPEGTRGGESPVRWWRNRP